MGRPISSSHRRCGRSVTLGPEKESTFTTAVAVRGLPLGYIMDVHRMFRYQTIACQFKPTSFMNTTEASLSSAHH